MNEIEPRLLYYYAQVDVISRLCYGVFTSTHETANDALYEYVRIDSLDMSYDGKYYINGSWYEDAAGTIPWAPTT